ncbi:hypothetical protein [Saccharopolyspora spinosa]|uniref:Uncharacterized protein n=1 Tax=Saccharopolyspora spinosa TaxID=60894 RepID=A0A2N3Y6V2_SACSN|nr:hypothetical protein [Saccharopolyspora spinosa]PKW18640.1 hypothetical protein A8926_6750 [Saccharopolyspora spinosa]
MVDDPYEKVAVARHRTAAVRYLTMVISGDEHDQRARRTARIGEHRANTGLPRPIFLGDYARLLLPVHTTTEHYELMKLWHANRLTLGQLIAGSDEGVAMAAVLDRPWAVIDR